MGSLQSYPVHAVSLVEHETGIVLTQGHVERADTETNERSAKAEANDEPKRGKKGKSGELTEQEKEQEQEAKKQRSELAVAYRLIAHIDWKGKVLTGDALYCQRCLCAAILLAGGDDLFLVKANQPQLLEDLCLLFAPPAPAKRAGEGILHKPSQQAEISDKGHGRVEIRSIRVSSELQGYSDWPGLDPRLPDSPS